MEQQNLLCLWEPLEPKPDVISKITNKLSHATLICLLFFYHWIMFDFATAASLKAHVMTCQNPTPIGDVLTHKDGFLSILENIFGGLP